MDGVVWGGSDRTGAWAIAHWPLFPLAGLRNEDQIIFKLFRAGILPVRGQPRRLSQLIQFSCPNQVP